MSFIELPGDPVSLREAAGSYDVLAGEVRQARSLLAASDVNSLTGDAADAMKARFQKVLDGLEKEASSYQGLGRQLRSTADEMDRRRTEEKDKLIALGIGAGAAAVVGFALTWVTGGVSTYLGELAASAAVEYAGVAVGSCVAAFVQYLTTVVTWTVTNFAIGLLEGLTFTGVQEKYLGEPLGISSDQAKQIAAIAVGNTIGRGVGLGVGQLANLTKYGETIAAKITAGTIAGGTLGTINPVLVSEFQGTPIDPKVVGTSAAVNAVLGGAVAGGIGALGGTRYGSLGSTIKAWRTPAGGTVAQDVELPGNIRAAGSQSQTVSADGVVTGQTTTAEVVEAGPSGSTQSATTQEISVDQRTGVATVTETVTTSQNDGEGVPTGSETSQTRTTTIGRDGAVIGQTSGPEQVTPARTDAAGPSNPHPGTGGDTGASGQGTTHTPTTPTPTSGSADTGGGSSQSVSSSSVPSSTPGDGGGTNPGGSAPSTTTGPADGGGSQSTPAATSQPSTQPSTSQPDVQSMAGPQTTQSAGGTPVTPTAGGGAAASAANAGARGGPVSYPLPDLPASGEIEAELAGATS